MRGTSPLPDISHMLVIRANDQDRYITKDVRLGLAFSLLFEDGESGLEGDGQCDLGVIPHSLGFESIFSRIGVSSVFMLEQQRFVS